jgi:hypothetical protein
MYILHAAILGSIDREPVKILRSPDKRLGQVGNTCGKWDNGFYTRGFIQDIPLDVLIDNGSTTTILSNHMFIQMMHRKKDLELQHAECTLYRSIEPMGSRSFPGPLCSVC